jgi:hypothetical protein
MRVEAIDEIVLTSLLALIQQRVSPIINVDSLYDLEEVIV